MSKIRNKNVLLFTLILATGFMRMFHILTYPTLIVLPDTYGYYNVGRDMLTKLLFVHDFRTPFYPIFLHLVTTVLGHFATPIFSNEFSTSMIYATIVQSILGIVSLIFLYDTLLMLKVRPIFSFFATLFIGINVNWFGWERMLVPESFTSFFLILTAYIAIRILEHPKKHFFVFLFLVFVILFTLKPVYAFFPFPILLMLCLYHRKNDITQKSILTLSCFGIVVGGYIGLNTIHFHYTGISRASDINLLGQILKFHLGIEQQKEEYFSSKIKKYQEEGRDPNPYRFLEYYSLSPENNREVFNKLTTFNTMVIRNNLGKYVSKSVQEIPKSLIEEDILLPSSHTSLPPSFFHTLHRWYTVFQYITLITLFAFPFNLLRFLKKRDIQTGGFILFGTIAFYQLFASVFFSYGEFARLLSVIQPHLFLFSLYVISKIPFTNNTF